MKSADIETCKTCRYGMPDGVTVQCRRYPPVPLLLPAAPSPRNPQGGLTIGMVASSNPPEYWCGEYQSKAVDTLVN